MMMCSKCGANIGEGAKFCSACGSAMQVVSSCVKCGAQVDADARFCPNCGSRIGDGRLLGDRNVIAGDVIGHSERYDVSNGGVVVKSVNEAGEIVECSECTRRMPKGSRMSAASVAILFAEIVMIGTRIDVRRVLIGMGKGRESNILRRCRKHMRMVF